MQPELHSMYRITFSIIQRQQLALGFRLIVTIAHQIRVSVFLTAHPSVDDFTFFHATRQVDVNRKRKTDLWRKQNSFAVQRSMKNEHDQCMHAEERKKNQSHLISPKIYSEKILKINANRFSMWVSHSHANDETNEVHAQHFSSLWFLFSFNNIFRSLSIQHNTKFVCARSRSSTFNAYVSGTLCTDEVRTPRSETDRWQTVFWSGYLSLIYYCAIVWRRMSKFHALHCLGRNETRRNGFWLQTNTIW